MNVYLIKHEVHGLLGVSIEQRYFEGKVYHLSRLDDHDKVIDIWMHHDRDQAINVLNTAYEGDAKLYHSLEYPKNPFPPTHLSIVECPIEDIIKEIESI